MHKVKIKPNLLSKDQKSFYRIEGKVEKKKRSKIVTTTLSSLECFACMGDPVEYRDPWSSGAATRRRSPLGKAQKVTMTTNA